jgi:predicted RNA-binding Zn-ribbon protein involved in translation (DUF1610 family)
MTNTAEIYCSHCQKSIKPIKSLINYHCPKCGATFMASQVEQDAACEPKQLEHDTSLSEALN